MRQSIVTLLLDLLIRFPGQGRKGQEQGIIELMAAAFETKLKISLRIKKHYSKSQKLNPAKLQHQKLNLQSEIKITKITKVS